MRTKSIILLLIALGFGLVASIGMSQLAGGEKVEDVPTAPVYVAMTNVAIGELLTEENVKLEQWPADRIPEGGISTPEALENMVPKQPLFSGEPIIAGRISDKDKLDTASKVIKKGYRVVSLNVTMESSVSHLIFPGDHVDIMSVNRERGKAETILENVEVFAINSEFKRIVDEDGGSIQGKTVSVQVKPDQAAKIAYHADSSGGKLRLALRSKDDDDDVVTEDSGSVDPLLALRANLPVEPATDNSFVMQVVSGDGKVQKYTWDDADSGELPNEANSGAGSSGGNGGLPPFRGPAAGDEGGGEEGEESGESDVPRLDSVFSF